LLTIGVPVFNGERYLEAAIESVLAQSFGDYELIISDNASTDGTEAIGRAVAARDGRVSYRRNPVNIGLAANFNLLVHAARGRLFKWAAADDVLRPAYLERCVTAIDGDPSIVLVYAKADFEDGSGGSLDLHDPGWHLVSDDAAARLSYAIRAGHFVNAILGVIRTESLRRTRLMPPYQGGDYRLMAELAVLGKLVEIPERLYVRRVHEASSKGNAEDVVWMRQYWSGSPTGMRAAYWHLCGDLAGIVLRAPIPFARKGVLLTQLARTMGLRRTRLLSELRELAHV